MFGGRDRKMNADLSITRLKGLIAAGHLDRIGCSPTMTRLMTATCLYSCDRSRSLTQYEALSAGLGRVVAKTAALNPDGSVHRDSILLARAAGRR
jgi:hypothetical protein